MRVAGRLGTRPGEDPNAGTYTPEKYGFGCTTSGGGTGSSWLGLALGLLLLRRRD